MHRRWPPHWISFKDFLLPFGVELFGNHRWIKRHALIPWMLEDDYASQFCRGFDAPAKPFPLSLGALIISADAGYQGVEKRDEMHGRGIGFRVARRPGNRRVLPPTSEGRLDGMVWSRPEKCVSAPRESIRLW